MLSQKSLAEGLAVYLVTGSGPICMNYCSTRERHVAVCPLWICRPDI